MTNQISIVVETELEEHEVIKEIRLILSEYRQIKIVGFHTKELRKHGD